MNITKTISALSLLLFSTASFAICGEEQVDYFFYADQAEITKVEAFPQSKAKLNIANTTMEKVNEEEQDVPSEWINS